MKINKNIPLERYTDNVRKLILTPHSPAYTLMLSGIGEKRFKHRAAPYAAVQNM